MNGPALIERAERYVKYSNERRIEAALRLFHRDAIYRSSQMGTREGLQRIAAGIRAFFGEFPVLSWEVERFDLVAPDTVDFSFEMMGQRAGSGRVVARSGKERLTFDEKGRITRVEVALESEVELEREEQGDGEPDDDDTGVPGSAENDDLVADLFDE